MAYNTRKDSKFETFTNVLDHIERDAFEVHGTTFLCKDLIQALLYISPFMYSVVQNRYNPAGVNMFMITINKEDECMLVQAGRRSKVQESKLQDTPSNSVMVHKETGLCTFLLSVGFLFDNFEAQVPKEENDGMFVIEETGDLVLMRSDLESLIVV